MPFTFSHPAIALPLSIFPKKWFSVTGLVIGSMVPDFEYFLRMRIKSLYSHSPGGLFWFDLPMGLLLAFLFHLIIRNELLDNLPAFLKSRFSAFRQFNWKNYFIRNWLVVIISILSGALSHLLWDSFTHPDGYFVRTIPFLSKGSMILGYHLSNMKILQHSSTLLGGLVILVGIYRLPVHTLEKHTISLKYWFILTVLTLIIIALRLQCGLPLHQYGNLIVTGISAGLISLTLTPILVKRKIWM
jgi:hypothetical protein